MSIELPLSFRACGMICIPARGREATLVSNLS